MRTVVKYEDNEVLVAYKPAGLAVQTARIGQPDMVSELKNYLKGAYVGIVHRLDQPVEGLLVFGKTPSAAAALSAQLTQKNSPKDRFLHKNYYAVLCMDIQGLGHASDADTVSGPDSIEKVCLTDYILKTKDNRAEIVAPSQSKARGAKKAVLYYTVRESMILDPAKIALADISIETGRFHQIRAQMAHAGLPLLGDQKYGTPLSQDVSRSEGVKNVALCAYKLCFEHPKTKKLMDFTVVPQGTVFHKFGIFNIGDL